VGVHQNKFPTYNPSHPGPKSTVLLCVDWGPHHKRCPPDGYFTRRIVSGDLIPLKIGYLDMVRKLSTKSQSKNE